MNSYKELLVWQKGFDLTIRIYELTSFFPKSEIFGLSSQIQRACVAIPANIAEGYGRNHAKEYCQFLRIAYASAAELETELLIAQRLNYGKTELYPPLFSLLEEISKMLFVLNKKISQS